MLFVEISNTLLAEMPTALMSPTMIMEISLLWNAQMSTVQNFTDAQKSNASIAEMSTY